MKQSRKSRSKKWLTSIFYGEKLDKILSLTAKLT